MELKQLYIYPVGAYLLAQDTASQQWAGAFCWSGEQIFRVMSKWNVPIHQGTEIASKLSQPEHALIPKTNVRQPVHIEGTIAVRIAQQFDRVNVLHQMGNGKQLTAFPPIPPEQIVACFVDMSEKTHRSAALFYTDQAGTPNMVLIRNQLQSLMVLSFAWMNEEQKTSCQNYLKHLPVMGDDDLEVPILVQGEIIQLLIAGIIMHSVMMQTQEQS